MCHLEPILLSTITQGMRFVSLNGRSNGDIWVIVWLSRYPPNEYVSF